VHDIDFATTARHPAAVASPDRDPNPQNWVLDVDQKCIDLYLELLRSPRALIADEAVQMVDLVDAWRAGEHEKHIALMAALAEVRRLTQRQH
jgi:hypothetical protein